MPTVRRHMSASIEGLLRWPDSKLNRIVLDDYGNYYAGKKCRKELIKMLSEGKKVIPCGDCEGFDYVTGCPGHPTKPNDEKREMGKKNGEGHDEQ